MRKQYPVPVNQEQREQLAWASDAFRNSNTNELANSIYDSLYANELRIWRESQHELLTNKSAVHCSQKKCSELDKAFDRSARLWAASLYDEDGRSLVLKLKPLLRGMSLAQLLKEAPIQQVTCARELFAKLDAHTELRGDEEALSDFREKTEALAEAIKQDAEANKALQLSTKTYADATKAYIAAYRKMRKAMIAILGKQLVEASFPQFVMITNTPSKSLDNENSGEKA